MDWSFAIVNGKLSEIYYNKNKKGEMKFIGFCHVNKSDYKTKMEQKYILHDTAKFVFTFRNGVYKQLSNDRTTKTSSILIS